MHAELPQPFDFGNERGGIDHHPIADDAPFPAAQDAGRDQVQDVFCAAVNDGVARVVAALAADDDVRLGGENVDDLPFALIAPLRANQNCVRHEKSKDNKLSRRIRLDTFGTAQNDRVRRGRRKKFCGAPPSRSPFLLMLLIMIMITGL